MVKIQPQIILRAEMVTPERVPAAISSVFDRLGNFLLPKLGIHMALEFFDTGWLSFFGSVADFRAYFSRPIFSDSSKTARPVPATGDSPLMWDYWFERRFPDVAEDTLGKVLRRFYAVPGSLGEGSITEIPGPGVSKRYRITYPSLVAYATAVEGIVKQSKGLSLTLPRCATSKES